MSFGTGNIQFTSQAARSSPITGADQGVSINSLIVQLGQAVGEPGDPADVTQIREIPLNASGIFQERIVIDPTFANGPTFFMDNVSGDIAYMRLNTGLNIVSLCVGSDPFNGLGFSYTNVTPGQLFIGQDGVFVGTVFPVQDVSTVIVMSSPTAQRPALFRHPGGGIDQYIDGQFSGMLFIGEPAAATNDTFTMANEFQGLARTFFCLNNTGGTLTVTNAAGNIFINGVGQPSWVATSDGTNATLTLKGIGQDYYATAVTGTWV